MSTLLSFFCMNVDQESRTDTANSGISSGSVSFPVSCRMLWKRQSLSLVLIEH